MPAPPPPQPRGREKPWICRECGSPLGVVVYRRGERTRHRVDPERVTLLYWEGTRLTFVCNACRREFGQLAHEAA